MGHEEGFPLVEGYWTPVRAFVKRSSWRSYAPRVGWGEVGLWVASLGLTRDLSGPSASSDPEMNRVAGEFPRIAVGKTRRLAELHAKPPRVTQRIRIAVMNTRRELLVNQGKSGRFVSMMPRRVVVYSRQGCHLCDQAMQLLQEAGLKPEEVDIDQDPELVERFTTCVPVVEIDGRIRFRGRVNAVLLHRLLQADADRRGE